MRDDDRLLAARALEKTAISKVREAQIRFGSSPRYTAWLAQFRLHRALRARAAAATEPAAARHAARVEPKPSQSSAGVASQRLLRLTHAIAAQERVSIGTVIDRLGPSSLGLVLLILTIPAIIPIPGPVGIVLGSCLALVALQVIAGARRVWLPRWLRERGLPTRRWMALSGRIARPFLGLAILAMALIITLPIPLGNILPVIALAMLALALLERDGVAVLWALAMSLVAIVWTIVLVLFGARIVEAMWSLFT